MSLAKNQIKFLRGKCQSLSPVVMIGQKGLTPQVLKELDSALNAHELVKIKIAAEDKKSIQVLIEEIRAVDAAIERVQSIGKMLSVFRRNAQKPRILLPSN